jgi:hypothetical protein
MPGTTTTVYGVDPVFYAPLPEVWEEIVNKSRSGGVGDMVSFDPRGLVARFGDEIIMVAQMMREYDIACREAWSVLGYTAPSGVGSWPGFWMNKPMFWSKTSWSVPFPSMLDAAMYPRMASQRGWTETTRRMSSVVNQRGWDTYLWSRPFEKLDTPFPAFVAPEFDRTPMSDYPLRWDPASYRPMSEFTGGDAALIDIKVENFAAQAGKTYEDMVSIIMNDATGKFDTFFDTSGSEPVAKEPMAFKTWATSNPSLSEVEIPYAGPSAGLMRASVNQWLSFRAKGRYIVTDESSEPLSFDTRSLLDGGR